MIEALRALKEVDGEEVAVHEQNDPGGSSCCVNVYILFDFCELSFDMQNGPVSEVGKNGCQVTALIDAARQIIGHLNESHPCKENDMTLGCLRSALDWQRERTRKREAHNVEGTGEV